MKKKHAESHKHHVHVEVKKKRRPFRKLFILIAILLGITILGVHLLSTYFLGVSVTTLVDDVLVVSGVTSPTVEEIQALPIGELSANVEKFIDAYNEGNPPEPAGLDDGQQGLVVADGEEIVLEATVEVRGGKIVAIDYSGLPAGISEDDIIEMDEKMFRLVFGGDIPESLPGVLDTYSKSKGGN